MRKPRKHGAFFITVKLGADVRGGAFVSFAVSFWACYDAIIAVVEVWVSAWRPLSIPGSALIGSSERARAFRPIIRISAVNLPDKTPRTAT